MQTSIAKQQSGCVFFFRAAAYDLRRVRELLAVNSVLAEAPASRPYNASHE